MVVPGTYVVAAAQPAAYVPAAPPQSSRLRKGIHFIDSTSIRNEISFIFIQKWFFNGRVYSRVVNCFINLRLVNITFSKNM